MNKKKVSVPVLTLNVLAVVFLLIGAFSVWYTYDYISEAAASGYIVSDNLKIVLNLYFSQCAPSFAYAFLLYTGGVIISRLNHLDTAFTKTEAVCEEIQPQEVPEAVEEV